MDAAALLGVSYQYFMSIETGQRELSRPLAGKMARVFGVERIADRAAQPLIRSSNGKEFVPFTREAYLDRQTRRPSFFIEDANIIVTPNPADYAKCARALLQACESRHTLRPAISGFVQWFVETVSSDAVFESFKEVFDRLYPGQRRKNEAFVALTVEWGKRVENDVGKEQDRRESDRTRKRKKRTGR